MHTIFIDDYSEFHYTQIQAVITSNICPSDYKDDIKWFDLEFENFQQKDCFIGKTKIDEILVSKRGPFDKANITQPPKWDLTIIIPESKEEDACVQIIEEYCCQISLHYLLNATFQNCGFSGFAIEPLSINRRYARANHIFGEIDHPMHCGFIETKTKESLRHGDTILTCPADIVVLNTFEEAFIKAMKCQDLISRFILLYYVFEKLYDTDIYKKHIDTYGSSGKNRPFVLYETLSMDFKINEYSWYSERNKLSQIF